MSTVLNFLITFLNSQKSVDQNLMSVFPVLLFFFVPPASACLRPALRAVSLFSGCVQGQVDTKEYSWCSNHLSNSVETQKT
jgi:hypothetical protein